MKNYFHLSEFFDRGDAKYFREHDVQNKIMAWQKRLNPIREALGEPITITSGVREYDPNSEHAFKGEGALDIRPTDTGRPDLFIRLGELLVQAQSLRRVCFYPIGKNFPHGGFHIDMRSHKKVYYVSDRDAPEWSKITEDAFLFHVTEEYNQTN